MPRPRSARDGVKRCVLLLGSSTGDLVLRLRRLRFHPFPASTREAALHALESSDPPIRGALLPPRPPLADLGRTLRLLRERSAYGLGFAVVGDRSESWDPGELREAGVRLALWAPFDDEELRFVVNHALHPPGRDESRREIRAPTGLLARIHGGPTEKSAHVYSLSVGGAFLKTARVTPVGCEIWLEIDLPTSCARLRAVVVHHNAPGNLERPTLPHGMGVRFLDMDGATREAISAYVEDRVRRYSL